MQKLVDYISFGKGFGLRWLFLFCVVLSFMAAVFVKHYGDGMVPSLQETAAQILPIKVEHGQIVTPSGLNQTFKIKLSKALPEVSFPFFVNTEVDDLEMRSLEPGVYMTRRSVYMVSNDKVEVREISGTFEIPAGDYTETLKTNITYIASIVGLICVPIFFTGFLMLALLYSLTALVLLKMFEKEAGFDTRMRLSVCGIILIYSLKYLVSISGTGISALLIFALIVAFQAIFIYKGLPKPKRKRTKKSA